MEKKEIKRDKLGRFAKQDKKSKNQKKSKLCLEVDWELLYRQESRENENLRDEVKYLREAKVLLERYATLLEKNDSWLKRTIHRKEINEVFRKYAKLELGRVRAWIHDMFDDIQKKTSV